MATTKPCITCKWCEIRQAFVCFHPKVLITVTDYLTGTDSVKVPTAQTGRTIGTCLPAGIFHEADLIKIEKRLPHEAHS